MPTRLTKTYEQEIIKEYLATRSNIKSIRHPDPPDCIIEFNNGLIEWIEITAAYRSGELAKALNSDITGELFSEFLAAPDDYRHQHISIICKRINAKNDKKNYETFNDLGIGILVVYIDDPLASPDDLEFIAPPSHYAHLRVSTFETVYLFIRLTYELSGVDRKRSKINGFHKLIG